MDAARMANGKHRRRITGGERASAVGSILCGLLVALMLVIFCLRNLALLGLALVGLWVTAVGLWWAVAERMPRRALGISASIAGVVLIVLACVRATPHGDRPLLRLVVLAVLLVGSVGFGRTALRRYLYEHDQRQPISVKQPLHPVLICNPWSGGGKVARFNLVDLAEDLGVEVVMLDHGLDLEQLARDAIADGADCLGMAGGDGSQALVASIAIEHGLPFVMLVPSRGGKSEICESRSGAYPSPCSCGLHARPETARRVRPAHATRTRRPDTTGYDSPHRCR